MKKVIIGLVGSIAISFVVAFIATTIIDSRRNIQKDQPEDVSFRSDDKGFWSQRKDLIYEDRILWSLDYIEFFHHADTYSFMNGFKYLTFVRQEYPAGIWTNYVIFSNSDPDTFTRTATNYKLYLPVPNVIFSVSRDVTVKNRLSYSSPSLIISGRTISETTYETGFFLKK